jgi:hypothetical protein
MIIDQCVIYDKYEASEGHQDMIGFVCFDKVCLVGKSRFHHFNDGGSLIITTPHKIGPRA